MSCRVALIVRNRALNTASNSLFLYVCKDVELILKIITLAGKRERERDGGNILCLHWRACKVVKIMCKMSLNPLKPRFLFPFPFCCSFALLILRCRSLPAGLFRLRHCFQIMVQFLFPFSSLPFHLSLSASSSRCFSACFGGFL